MLDACKTIDARVRLEDMDDTINTSGAQGKTEETGGPPPMKTNYPPLKVKLVGLESRQAELRHRAYPEYFKSPQETAAERYAAQQKARIDAIFAAGGVTHSAVRLKVVRDVNGEVVRYLPEKPVGDEN